MIIEQLKNKKQYYENGRFGTDIAFKEEDIKSAVEWLKVRIYEHKNPSPDRRLFISYDKIRDIIDKAFEDVIKE